MIELVVPFVQAVALPATIIFLVLHFQEVIQKRLRAEASAGQDGRGVISGQPIVDVDKARTTLKGDEVDELSDQQLVDRVRGCLVTREELRLLATLVACDGVSNRSSFSRPADLRAIQGLVAKNYVEPVQQERYALTESGRGLFQVHLERMSRAQQT